MPESGPTQNILWRKENHLAHLTINRPARLNALDQATWEQLSRVLDEIAADNTIRAVIFGSSGGNFSAGADISEFATLAQDPERLRANNAIVQRAQEKLEELARPTIAAVAGHCFGGGCGLALACDFRIAADNAVFAITPAKLGLIYSLRDTSRLVAAVGSVFAKEMLYCGRRLDATEAQQRGLVNRVVPTADLTNATRELADSLAMMSQYSIRGIKQVIAHIDGYGAWDKQKIQEVFDAAFTADDCLEGTRAFLEKRKPVFN